MEAMILPDGIMFDLWHDGEVIFTRPDRNEVVTWAQEHGYTIVN